MDKYLLTYLLAQIFTMPLEKVEPFNDFVDFCTTFHLTHGKSDRDEMDVVGEFKVTYFHCT